MVVGLKGFLAVIKKGSFYFFLLLVVFAELLTSVLFVPSAWKEIGDYQAKISNLKADSSILTKAVSVLSSANSDKVVSDLVKAEAALPNEKKVSGLISGLTNLASSSGVAVQALEFAPGKISSASGNSSASGIVDQGAAATGTEVIVGNEVRAVRASLVVVATLDNTLDLLNRLRRASQILGVTQVDFSSMGPQLSSTQMAVLIYYQPEVSGEIAWSSIRSVSADEEKILTGLASRDIFSLPSGSH